MVQQSLEAGEKIAEYVVERRLGIGGFGVTYLAHDPVLNKRFAIKEYYPRELATRDASKAVIPLDPAHQDAFHAGLRRFLEEARTLAKFDDPAIVSVNRILQGDDTPYKTAFIVMDFIDGETLSEKLKREGQIPPGEARRLLLKIADGLASVHEAGILHRDIKPGNILLRSGSDPVLIDFGAAKAAAQGEQQTMTAIWTPGFGAKEQMSEAEKEGPYTDVYGLSAVGYCMVTGKRPLDAANRFPDDPIDKLAPIAETPLEKALFTAIDHGMLPYKEDRPQKLEDWSRAFRDIEGEPDIPSKAQAGARPIDPAAPGPKDSPPSPQSRKSLAIAASLLLGAAAVVMLAVFMGDLLPTGNGGSSSSEPIADGPTEIVETPVAETPPQPAAPVSQRYAISNARWLEIRLPDGAQGDFALAADGRYRVRIDGDLFVHPGGAATMSIGDVPNGVLEVKAVDSATEIELVYTP